MEYTKKLNIKYQILSERGHETMDLCTFVIQKDGNFKFWRCEERCRRKARIHIVDGEVTKIFNVYPHDSSTADAEVKSIVKRKSIDPSFARTATLLLINLFVTFFESVRIEYFIISTLHSPLNVFLLEFVTMANS